MTTHRAISRRAATALVWFGALALATFPALWAVDAVRDRLLADSAEATAVQYARFVGDAVPGMDRLLRDVEADATTFEDLRRVRALGDVFRFKLFDRDGRTLLVSDDLDAASPELLARTARIGDHHGGNGHVASIVLGGENHVALEDGREKPDRPDLYSEAYVPLVQDGETIGVIEVYVDQTGLAARIDRAFAAVAGVVAATIALLAAVAGVQLSARLRERERASEKIRHLADHDTLSGVLNRGSFVRALEAEAAGSARAGDVRGFSVMCVDLDRFKEVNDTLGHATGDAVLREVASRLQGAVRGQDLVARLGGDEFALLLRATTDADELALVGRRVVAALGVPIEVDGQSVPCGASVGTARFGEDADTVEELLHRADLAMYRSKQDGRGRFSFYDPTLDHALEQRRRMTLALRSAIDEEALSAHFQPLFSGGPDGTLVGYEALMRWQHPTLGSVPPSEFIPLAEETGLIDGLGEWMLRTACATATTWPAPLRVAVNLSPAQFRGRRPVVELVTETLERTGLAPERLELEITESLLIGHADEALETLNALSALGVRIALDDFGTGYSSLGYLWRFPFDKLKIDRSFTQRLGDDDKVDTIVRSIVGMAHSMGIRVNAEGVETDLQRSRLAALGCDELQGYLLGRPSPADRLGPGQGNAVPDDPARRAA